MFSGFICIGESVNVLFLFSRTSLSVFSRGHSSAGSGVILGIDAGWKVLLALDYQRNRATLPLPVQAESLESHPNSGTVLLGTVVDGQIPGFDCVAL